AARPKGKLRRAKIARSCGIESLNASGDSGRSARATLPDPVASRRVPPPISATVRDCARGMVFSPAAASMRGGATSAAVCHDAIGPAIAAQVVPGFQRTTLTVVEDHALRPPVSIAVFVAGVGNVAANPALNIRRNSVPA